MSGQPRPKYIGVASTVPFPTSPLPWAADSAGGGGRLKRAEPLGAVQSAGLPEHFLDLLLGSCEVVGNSKMIWAAVSNLE